jgi:conjugative relaxase-like TrwC/TraI family protein
VRGEWQGQLADRRGLQGELQEQQFARLTEGEHPETGERLVRHQTAREYGNAHGNTVRTIERRAGWDATFSAPRSVSRTALAGGNDRVHQVHRKSVRTALDNTNDAKTLGYELSRGASHPAAILKEPGAAQKTEPQSVSKQVAQGLSAG